MKKMMLPSTTRTRKPAVRMGLAVDLGTAGIAGYLLDMDSGGTLAAREVENPQSAFGEDVITRLDCALRSQSDGRKLQELAVEALNRLACELCADVGAGPEDITEAVVVGNTAMHHLLLGLTVEPLALSPFYSPAHKEPMDMEAAEAGLRLGVGASLHMPPCVAGFVGSDHVAMLLATQLRRAEGPALALDIGTNTEVALAAGDEICCVSCAAGPAFEGARIKDGMRAGPGAIEKLRLSDDGVECETIGNAAAAGLCGSGVLDAVARLFQAGVLDGNGKMLTHPRVRAKGGQLEFVLVGEKQRGGRPALTVTQRDVREVQLAKGAVAAGIQVLLEEKKCAPQDIRRVVIAGAFGSSIDVGSAMAIGMLPRLPHDRVQHVGNAAGRGAGLILVDQKMRNEARATAGRARHIELATVPHFNDIFVESTGLEPEKMKTR